MNIVIADRMEPEVVEEIRKLGTVTLTPADLKAALPNAEALIVRSATKVTAELLTHAPRLKVVARAGVGLDNVDAAACALRRIKVINTPGASSNAVAELVLAMMFSLARRLPKADSSMKGRQWLKKELTGSELDGKTLGIVGLGRIGSILAAKAGALGMKVIYFDPRASGAAAGKPASLDELLSQSDYLTLHVPLTNETKGMINAASLAKMKPSAFLINTARGGLVDEAALFAALSSGKLSGAALDVYSAEPYSGKLCELANVVLTPHIAGSTKEAQLRIGAELVEKLKAELK